MCPNCAEFREQIDFASSDEFCDLAREMEKILSEGLLVLIADNCMLAGIRTGPPFAADPAVFQFRCPTCDQGFHLDFSSYPGRGGSWHPIELDLSEWGDD